MQYYLNLFTRILLLRAAPAEVPASLALFWLTFLLLTGLALLKGLLDGLSLLDNLAFSAVNFGSLFLFVYVLLYLVKRRQRFLQTITTVFGINVYFYVLDFPAFWVLVSGAFPLGHIAVTLSSLYFFVLLVYSVFVTGHVLHHAMEVPVVVGVLLTLGYYVANSLLLRGIFPEITS